VTELAVSELFVSIQGETTAAGLPCTFIRLAGCNLRCSYCDASYTYEEPSRRLTMQEILAWVAAQSPRLVAVTGGEPLLQPAVIPLLRELVGMGLRVLLETNGSLSVAPVPDGVTIIMDVKCPASGMHDRFDPDNLHRLRPGDEIKFVLCDRQDYLWAREFMQTHHLAGREVLLSPVADRLPPALLADWILADGLPCRLQLQLHKILWPDAIRGK